MKIPTQNALRLADLLLWVNTIHSSTAWVFIHLHSLVKIVMQLTMKLHLAQPIGPRWKIVAPIIIFSQLQRCVWKSGLKGTLYKPIWSYIRWCSWTHLKGNIFRLFQSARITQPGIDINGVTSIPRWWKADELFPIISYPEAAGQHHYICFSRARKQTLQHHTSDKPHFPTHHWITFLKSVRQVEPYLTQGSD